LTKQAHNAPSTIASYLLPIVKALESRGVDSEPLLQQAGIQGTVANDPLVRLPHHQLGEVFRLAVEATGDPRFGLYASRYMLPSHIHALGTAMLASRSLMDLCLRVERFGLFLAQTAAFYVESIDRETKFSAHLNVPLRAEATDMFWSFILRLMRHLDNENLNPSRVDVTVEESPEALAAYEKFFRCPINFGCGEMALYFDTATLERELPTASHELARLSDQVVQDYLAKMDRDDIVSRVNSLLVANLPAGEYSKEDAARELYMSARTLQKKLQEAGTTWRELLEGTRKELAISYLGSGRYSLAEITFMLGFNDTSSFSRAFRRWTGKAPGSFAQSAAD
jgi:AraC-like DNA-binding protein